MANSADPDQLSSSDIYEFNKTQVNLGGGGGSVGGGGA